MIVHYSHGLFVEFLLLYDTRVMKTLKSKNWTFILFVLPAIVTRERTMRLLTH